MTNRGQAAAPTDTMQTDTDETVEVVYATAETQCVVAVPFTPGLTAGQAVEHSCLIDDYPEIQRLSLVLGVFGERVEEARKLVPGERVEICRPLQQDPREMRSNLVASGGVMGRPHVEQEE